MGGYGIKLSDGTVLQNGKRYRDLAGDGTRLQEIANPEPSVEIGVDIGIKDKSHIKRIEVENPVPDGWSERFVEAGADIEHNRWARWQKYMFSKGTVDEQGVFHLPKEFVDRWFRQIDTKYADLSESEKESDRKETRNYLPLIPQELASARSEAIKDCLGVLPEKATERNMAKLPTNIEGNNICLETVGEVMAWNEALTLVKERLEGLK